MKNLLAFLAILASMHVSGQVNGFQLPYNPDVEPDGFIGVADVLAILPLYGQEFGSSSVEINSDSTSLAIEVSTNSSWFGCLGNCQALDGSWRMLTEADVANHWDLMVDNDWYWVKWPETISWDRQVVVQKNYSGYVAPADLNEQHRCICTTQQRPKVEYSYCRGPLVNDPSPFQQCATEKVENGWYPLGGVSQFDSYNDAFQAFWRWAD